LWKLKQLETFKQLIYAPLKDCILISLIAEEAGINVEGVTLPRNEVLCLIFRGA
jgi:hypothetical protein